MIRGSCLCGAVRYEIAAPPRQITHCHCSRCRKAHGAAFATYAAVAADAFRYVTGAERVVRYLSSPVVERCFCGVCGSNLAFVSAATPAEIWVPVGGFDADAGMRASSHIFVGSKAAWHDIADDLPQYRENLPGY